MKRLMAIVLVSFLVVALLLVQKGNVPLANASSSIYQGDLILTGNNVTTIEGRFDINGSIIVEDNATLSLKGAFLNFTQTGNRQYNLTLTNPSGGNPHLLAYNSTITSQFETAAYLTWNSTVIINNSTVSHYIFTADNAILSVSNHSYVGVLFAYGSSVINVFNSAVREWHNYNYGSGMLQVQVFNSEIALLVGPSSVNCTISKLMPGLFSYWSFMTNCSVEILLGGYTPNITLTNTMVKGWRFAFYGSSNAAIADSVLSDISAMDSSFVSAVDSTVSYLYTGDTSAISLVNSTYFGSNDQARVKVAWYLNVRVIDSTGQNVPSANVSAAYSNSTIAQQKLTNATGWARLILMEKMVNYSGQYPVGNYTVRAEYGTYSSSTKANMTGNQAVTIQLPFLVIPEFPSNLLTILTFIFLSAGLLLLRKKMLKWPN